MEIVLIILIITLPWALVNAKIASVKGRSPIKHFFLSLLFSPLIDSVYLVAIPVRPSVHVHRDGDSGCISGPSDEVMALFKSDNKDKNYCPRCNNISPGALKCRICGGELSSID